jgi:hypothetical protein
MVFFFSESHSTYANKSAKMQTPPLSQELKLCRSDSKPHVTLPMELRSFRIMTTFIHDIVNLQSTNV